MGSKQDIAQKIHSNVMAESDKKKRKYSKLLILFLTFLQIVASICLCYGLLVYGPYSTIRRYVIGTAMSTFSHQYIAELFFPKWEINQVLNAQKTAEVGVQNLASMKPANYRSSNLTVSEISSQNGSFHGYLIEVTDPLRVKLAYTKYLGKVGETTSDMAKDYNAVAAINGGGFYDGGSWTGTGALPTDYIISGGSVVWKNPNYHETSKSGLPLVIALDRRGSLIVGKYTISELLSMHVQYAVTMSGYQPLVMNGKGTYTNDGGRGYQPRTVIGQKADKTIMLLVLDGRRIGMKGASLLDAQKIMLDYGAVTAANLDGGNSTTMYYKGSVINQPSGDYGERTVATSFYVDP